MSYWYIDKNLIIRSISSKENIKDILLNTKIYDTYKDAVIALNIIKKKDIYEISTN